MSTTYKLYHAAFTDGVCYIDLPITGRITQVNFSSTFASGAGGIGTGSAELSRVAVNQMAVNNPRGVIALEIFSTAGASQGITVNHALFPDEPVKSGERLYLNCAYNNGGAGVSVNCLITIA